jgi:transcriptional regulator with XRE-family HTH domain
MKTIEQPISKFSVTLGKSLRTARARAGYSISALSEECGVSTGHICDIERGLAIPGADKLAKLAKVLNLDVPRLLGLS